MPAWFPPSDPDHLGNSDGEVQRTIHTLRKLAQIASRYATLERNPILRPSKPSFPQKVNIT
jgi:hypothetical protein